VPFAVFFLACADPPPPEAAPAPVPAPEAAAPAAPPAPRESPNRPPRIGRITLTPGSPTVTDGVTAGVEVSDPDGQPIDLDFTWTISGREVVGLASERLPPGKLAKGDIVQVVVKATDGVEEVTMSSAPATVANTAPVFDRTPGPRDKLDGFLFKAHDLDGDPLTWRLENAPSGMTIDARGLLRYVGSVDEKGGAYRVAVVAEDGETWSRYEIPLTISAGSGAVEKKVEK
jgi:hypothetical protein